jgi:hypothetical protein
VHFPLQTANVKVDIMEILELEIVSLVHLEMHILVHQEALFPGSILDTLELVKTIRFHP